MSNQIWPRTIGRVALIALALNAAWEMAHQSLYTVQGQGVPLSRLLRSILGDVLWVLVLIGLVAVIWRDRDWWLQPRRGQYLTLVIGGLALAAVVEIRAVYFAHLWAYRPSMPQVAGLGLTPLLQMTLLPALAVWLSVRFPRRLPDGKQP